MAIKINIDMPKSCSDCPCFYGGSYENDPCCQLTWEEPEYEVYINKRSDSCPLETL